MRPYLSVVIPVYNEEKNVRILFNKITSVLKPMGRPYEIIFVDDGSTDNTFRELDSIIDSHLRIIKMRKNFGQTAALDAGFKHSRGEIIITMDGDLQNDPADIPLLIKKINEGYDVVSGWRWKRKDPFSKKLLSKIANSMRIMLTKQVIHDSGCSLKAYKAEAIKDLDIFGEMHRYIPALLAWQGFRVGEVKVRHFYRKHGKSKYGMLRVFKGFLDLLVVVFWQKYSARPIHIFGGFGLLMIVAGGLVSVYMIIRRIIGNYSLSNRPLFLLAILTVILGFQFFMSGILADIAIKNYYKQNKKKNYSIERIIEK